MTTFRDDFNVFNTEIWDFFDSSKGRGQASCVDGKLRLSVSNLDVDEDVDVGITLKNTIDLNNTVLEIRIESLSGVYSLARLGVAITNVPFRLYSGAQPLQRGVFAHTVDSQFKILTVWSVRGSEVYEAWREFDSYPVIIRCYISRSGLYLYHVKNGAEFFFHNWDADIDLSNAYLSIFLLTDPLAPNASAIGRIDYISVSDATVPSTPPTQKAVMDVKVPDIPPEIVYPLLSNMMMIFLGNAILRIGESLKK